MKTTTILGAISGSSLDGLDMAICEFAFTEPTAAGLKSWTIISGTTVEYSSQWTKRLSEAIHLDGRGLCRIDADFGRLSGKMIREYLSDQRVEVEMIASHGHTVFHFPEEGFTTQIGSGASIAGQTDLPVITQFRAMDVAMGGQGAPIVPIAEKYLWPDFDLFLNLGGIANLSYRNAEDFLAGDVCTANQALNYLARKVNKKYDNHGEMADKGKLDKGLFAQLNKNDFYERPYPKSLDNGFSVSEVIPLLEESGLSIEDQLCTVCHHIGFQIAEMVDRLVPGKDERHRILITGGGAYNDFLVKCIRLYLYEYEYLSVEVVIPEPQIIEFKEALLMAWMGLLRSWNQPNVMASVTGARRDTCCGEVTLPK